MFLENERAILDAVWEDLRRPTGETVYYDFLLVKTELKKLLKNLRRWTRPERVGAFSLLTFPSSQWIEKEPYGVVLVVGPFNFPFALTAGVAAGAVAAGNNVVLKPSDVPAILRAPLGSLREIRRPESGIRRGPRDPRATAPDVTRTAAREVRLRLLHRIVSRGFHRRAQVRGGEAHPVALELGGKNPVFVTPTADLSLAAKQCVWGRTLNCGQQCIAPEYVLCHRSKMDDFTEHLRRWTRELIPDPHEDGAMGRMVGNPRRGWRASQVS